MSNVKPICLVYYRGTHGTIPIEKLSKILAENMPDYHVLTVPLYDNEGPIIELEVYYEKDWTELSIEELRKDIITHLEKLSKKKEDAKSDPRENY